MMKPSNHLRFVNRQIGVDGRIARILQQWWSLNPEHEWNWINKIHGEWRDVEIIEEEV